MRMPKLELQFRSDGKFDACDSLHHEECVEFIVAKTVTGIANSQKIAYHCSCVCHELPDVLTPAAIEDFLG